MDTLSDEGQGDAYWEAHVPLLRTPPRLIVPLRSVRPLGQALFMAALPHGGQRVARRNAWGGMSADAARGRTRRDADRAVRQAQDRAGLQAQHRG